MNYSRAWMAILMLFSLLVGGCAFRRKELTAPANSYKDQVIRHLTSNDWLKDYNDMPEGTDPEKKAKTDRRNRILYEFVWVLDDYYYQYERRLYHSRAGFATTSELFSLGLTSATAVVGGAQLKSILATVASGVTGTKATIDKQFFDEQSRAAIAAKMRALRAEKLVLIEVGSMKGLDEYSLSKGLSDLQEYFYAGTLVGALQDISRASAQQGDAARVKIDNARNPSKKN